MASSDFLDQLADLEVPPPPPRFDAELHEKVNLTLVLQHALEFVIKAFPWVIWQFARGFLGAVTYTLTGRYGDRPKKGPPL